MAVTLFTYAPVMYKLFKQSFLHANSRQKKKKEIISMIVPKDGGGNSNFYDVAFIILNW